MELETALSVLHEINHRERQIVYDLNYRGTLKKIKGAYRYREQIGWLPQLGWGIGELDAGDEKVQTYIYKINAWGCHVQHGNNSLQLLLRIFESCWDIKPD